VQDPLRHGGSSPWHTLGRLVLEKLPLFALVVASCIVTYLAQQQGGAMKYAEQLSPATRLANAPVVYVAYLGKAVCPTALAVFYPYTDRPTLRGGSSTWAVALAAAFLLTITVLVVAQVRRRPFLAVGWFWFVGMLLPVIGLVQVGKQAMADRYTYLPLVGIFLAVAWELRETPAAWRYRSAALTTLAVVALAVCVVLASSQVRTWENSHTLYEHALAVTENNALAHGNYGTLLFNEGKFDEAAGHYAEALRIDPDQPGPLCNAGLILYSQGRREEALARYREAVRLDPTLAVTRGNLGTLLREMGQAAEAERELREAVRLQPDGAEFHAALGCALSDLGRSAEAIEQFSESLRLRPDVVATHTNMATTLMTMGRLDEALAHLGEAIRLAPNEAPAYVNRGLALVAQGKLEEGIASYRRALQIAPNLPGVHNNLGLALVTQGKTDEGVAEYREAIRLDSRYANPHYNWAIVLARAGKTDEAVAHLEEALRLRPGWTEAAELLRALRGAAR
jgi:tetratricopeptide (TPR) repeat protein